MARILFPTPGSYIDEGIFLKEFLANHPPGKGKRGDT
jgi:hypothetical protein